MPEGTTMFLDVEFEAILRDIRQRLKLARTAGDKESIYALCVEIRRAKVFFQHTVIPAYGAEYDRQGRDFLDVAREAVSVASGSHFDEVKCSLKRHAQEIAESIQKLKQLQPA